MGKFFSTFIFLTLVAGAVFYFFYYDKTVLFKGTINLSVLEFTNGSLIPNKFTCEGNDIHPSFAIERVPGDTKSLVLIVDEPKASPAVFTHYILFNIDPETTGIDQGVTPAGTVTGTNDYQKKEYNGPCPALGTHRYVFRIFALNTVLNLDENASRKDIDNAMKGHIIAKGEFSGEYSKN